MSLADFYLENLIQSIEEAKGILLERIEARGEEFYQKTDARSLDNRVNLYAMGCSNPEFGIHEVFVGIQPTNQEDIARIEKVVSKMSGLIYEEEKKEYKYGDNFGIRFGEDNSVTIRYGQRKKLTNEGYRGRVGTLVDWLTGSLRPLQKVQVAGEAKVSGEETQVMTQKIARYIPIEDITPDQIYGKVEGIMVGGYHASATISDEGASKRVILRFDLGEMSQESRELCLKEVRGARYKASLDKNGLWVSRGFKSPTKDDIKELAEKIAIFLDIWGII